DHLRTALDGLGTEHRDAFLMKHLEGLSYQQIADVTGTSVSAAKMRVHRAREALRARLSDQGPDAPDVTIGEHRSSVR
ncbi:MAG TPA: RNA polymerase sigma factor, partial [Longimicrobiales bacterium]|nr:RNA polymerase sigma factor [Longimicrobiales bacterium]